MRARQKNSANDGEKRIKEINIYIFVKYSLSYYVRKVYNIFSVRKRVVI